MKALRVLNGELAVKETAVPAAGDEALVRVIRSGICNTDLEIARGYGGFNGTIGHEFVGIVEEAADHAWLGKRVVGEINVGCGNCALCAKGDPRHCAGRTVLGIHGRDGSHAEFLNLPARNLIEVPDNVPDDDAVFVEPLAAAMGITEQIELQDDTKVAVIGDGKLGILCVRGLGQLVDAITIVGRHSQKIEKAVKYGNVTGIKADQTAEIKGSFDVVVEASGSETGFSTALDLVRPRGKVVLKSTFHGRPTWEASKVVVNEITVVGSRCGRFGPALELLSSQRVKVDDLVSGVLPLSSGVAAMKRASEAGVLKVLLAI
jgi:threonine dehydrogenase-like Zn-dependent dehydrogenase